MNAEALYIFLDRFNNSIKLEYAFAISKLVMKQFETTNPDECTQLYGEWERIIKERFELNLKELEQTEAVGEKERKVLDAFLENLIKEINT